MSNCGTVNDPLKQCQNEQFCSPFDITTDPTNCFIQSVVEEHLNIGAAPINVFKLLGIHEQGKLVDLTGNGTAISSGEYPDYPAMNVFMDNFDEWRSTQKGSLITSCGFIGYDFGPIRLDNGRLRYSVETEVRHHITTIKIQQGCESKNRVSRARVERSDDGQQWFGVAIINLPNTDKIEQISFRQSAPARYWRIRPIEFLGGPSDYWAVKRLELIDYAATDLSNIQNDFGILENRDRAYAKESIQLKGFYDLQEPLTDLTRFGIDMSSTQQYIIRIAFNAVVRALGRPIVIGDILELPSETQYTPELKPVKKYLEVTDVTWAAEGYTPGWKPTIQRITAMPILASQETMDIIGDINQSSNQNNFANLETPFPFNMEGFTSSNVAQATADSLVPERGTDIANVRHFTEEEIAEAAKHGINLAKFNFNPRGLYVEDGLPPNGEPYTEGPTWPENPKDGDYHRLTYDTKYNIPPRLHKFSVAKNRWIFVEEDKRALYNTIKPTLQSLLNDPNKVHNNEIT